jgi:sorbitol-specific phosphotransferase system component IIC
MQRLCKQIPLLIVLLGLLLIALVLMIYRQRIRRIEQKIQKENRINANHRPCENFYI